MIEREKEQELEPAPAPSLDDMIATVKTLREEMDALKSAKEKAESQRDELLAMVFTKPADVAEPEAEPQDPAETIRAKDLKFEI